MSKMLYSYDVFDTVITRKTANPHGIFALLADLLKNSEEYSDIPKDVRENFFNMRIEAERYARKALCKPGRYEIDMDDIYYALNLSGELSDEQVSRIKGKEYRLEIENAVPIPEICEEIIAHLEAGDSVAFISDMYLPEDIVKSILAVASPRFTEIPLYVSSDSGYLKHNGFLFRYVKDKEQVEFENWTHTGDNATGDVEVPQKLGIRAIRVHSNMLLPLEKDFIGKHESDIVAQILIGTAKNSRLFHPSNVFIDTAASVSGVLLVSYALWIIEDAIKNGVHTLHFVARDGYVPKMIVDKIVEAKKLPIETKYIYGSRRSWRIPSFYKTEDMLTELYANADIAATRTMADLAKVFQVTKEELLSFLPNPAYFEERILARVDMNMLVQYLQTSTELPQFILSKNAEKRELAKKYLRTELDLSQSKVYFVELGGSGYTQYCLKRLIEEDYDGDIVTYYYHAYDGVKEEYRQYMKTFMPYASNDKSMIEPLCRAPQGSAVAYRMVGDKVEPVLDPYEKAPYERCGYPEYLQKLGDFVDELLLEVDNISSLYSGRNLLETYWEHLLNEPSEELLEFISEVPFDTSGYDGGRVFAPKLTEAEVADMLENGANRSAAYYNGAGALVYSLLRLDAETREKLYAMKKGCYPNAADAATVFIKMPEKILEKCKRIAIYGAGRVGMELQKVIPKERLSAWVDKNYIRFCDKEFKIESPKVLLDVDADIILIAVLDERLASDIKRELVALGVDEKKLEHITPCEYIFQTVNQTQ